MSLSQVRHNPSTDPADPLLLEKQLCFHIYAASHLFNRVYRPFLAELALTYPQYLVLLALWETSPQSVGALGEQLYLDSGTLTPLLKRLESAGLLQRQRATFDERRVLVDLTDRGRTLRDQAKRIPHNLAQQLQLSMAQIDLLRHDMQTLIGTLSLCLKHPPTPTGGFPMSTVYDIPVKRIDGTDSSLGAFKGKVLLVVNVASKCGLTPQYEGLEKLYQAKHGEGLEILGFPANNFKEQEPGTDAEIQSFCSLTYDVHFPLFSKISVKGQDRHPLYSALISAQPTAQGEGPFREKLKGFGIQTSEPPEVLWNFEKFLVNRQGEVIARFSPDTPADSPTLLNAIDEALAKAG